MTAARPALPGQQPALPGNQPALPGQQPDAAGQQPALAGRQRAPRRKPGWLLAAGVAAFAVAITGYVIFAVTHPEVRWINPVDLSVYQDGGLVVRHLTPLYRPQLKAPLYHWPGITLQFTYPPFSALVFTVLTLAPLAVLAIIFVGVNIAALLGTIWVILGTLGYRRVTVRLGATLLLAAALFWTEPVQRTLYLGQIELVLMLLICWDQCQPDRRWWKGAGIGIAAGLKLVPLIFIPYLLLTRRYRQAAVAAGVFAATVAFGFVALPGDSHQWWLGHLFYKGSRTGFVGWEGNQSVLGVLTRLAGSTAAGQPLWHGAALVIAVAGLVAAAVLDRGGQRLAGLLTCALTALLISPISWDHHWVWIVPGVVLFAHYAVRALSAAARASWAGAAIAVTALFGAWPGSLWGEPADLGAFSEGIIWAPPNTDPFTYLVRGDRRRYVEYHWHGLQLLTGNLYILAGMALFALALLAALSRAGRGGPAVAGGRRHASAGMIKQQYSGTGAVAAPQAD